MDVSLAKEHKDCAENWPVSVAFEPFGTRMTIAGEDSVARFYDRSCLTEIQYIEHDHESGVNQVGWVHSNILVTISDDGCVRFRDIVQNKVLGNYRLPNQATPMCLDIHPSLQIVTVGDSIGGVTSYHLYCADHVQHFDAHGKGIVAIKYSNDGRELATGSRDGIVRQWIMDPWPICFQSIVPRPVKNTCISTISYSPSDEFLLVGTLDSRLQLFPRNFQEHSSEPVEPQKLQRCVLRTFRGHKNRKYITATTFLLVRDNDGETQHFVLSGSDNGKIHCWNVDSSQEVGCWMAHQGPVLSLVVRPIDQQADSGMDVDEPSFELATVGGDGCLRVWRLTSSSNTEWKFPDLFSASIAANSVVDNDDVVMSTDDV